MFTLIEHGEIYAPEPLGVRAVLLSGGRIVRIGEVDRGALEATGLPCATIDARGCLVLPGLVDPHEHLIGAGGEQGFASRMPEVPFEDLVRAGVTTAVGCLGTDTTTRHLGALLGRVRQLRALGLSAFMYTGGFQVPPPTLTGSVMQDIVLIDAVLGVGEVAISDARASQPSIRRLARLVSDAMVAGTLAGKAGVTHFHVGPGRERLRMLHALLDRFEILPRTLYPTHINRTDALMDDAIALARRGAFVDIDTIDEDLETQLGYYLAHGGDPEQVTVSSDAHTRDATPGKLYGQLIGCARSDMFRLEQILPAFTRNPATALGLEHKGRLKEGADADVLIVDRVALELRHVFACGRHLLRDGTIGDPS